MKNKLSDIWFYITTDAMICITGFLCLLFTAWDWLKGLFVKEKPAVTDEKPVQFHCHQCGEVYLADREAIGFGFTRLMVSKPRGRPHCGSLKTMPVMFEEEGLYEKEYRRLWERYQTYK